MATTTDRPTAEQFERSLTHVLTNFFEDDDNRVDPPCRDQIRAHAALSGDCSSERYSKLAAVAYPSVRLRSSVHFRYPDLAPCLSWLVLRRASGKFPRYRMSSPVLYWAAHILLDAWDRAVRNINNPYYAAPVA